MALRDQPYFPFYVDDFLTDEKLNECSAKSTGVYIKILCIMHKMEQYGSIELKQKYKQNGSKNIIEGFSEMLTKQMSFSYKEILDGLTELISEDVLQLQGNLLIQKRMYRDGEVSRKRAEAGSKGGAKTTEDDKQNGSKTLSKTKAKDKQNPVYVYVNENDSVFEYLWGLYPKKRGKGQISKTQKAKLEKIGKEQLERCIERYTSEQTDMQYLKNGSTFFNSGYVDYLDENYSDLPKANKANPFLDLIEGE